MNFLKTITFTLIVILTITPKLIADDYFGMPDKLDVETWLIDDHSITTNVDDDDSILYEDPIRYIDLDNDGAYEIVLMAEKLKDRPDEIPPERSYLYIFKKFGENWDRMLFHDCGPGRFKHLAFPDFNNDGTPEILLSISSKYALDFDKFEILRRGGYYFRPWISMNKKIYMVSDLNGDGNLDIVTTHRYKPEEFFLYNGKQFKEVSFNYVKPYLLENRVRLYKHLLKKIEAKRKEFE